MHLQHVGEVGVSFYIDFQKARGRATARRRQLLVAAEKEGDTEALKKLALEECLQRRLIASEDGLCAFQRMPDYIRLDWIGLAWLASEMMLNRLD